MAIGAVDPACAGCITVIYNAFPRHLLYCLALLFLVCRHCLIPEEEVIFAFSKRVTMKNFREILRCIFTVPNTFDPDDLRRRQVLNGILLFMTFSIFIIDVTEFWDDNITLVVEDRDMLHSAVGGIGGFMFSMLLLLMNRSKRIPRNLVGWVFVLGMLIIILFSDYPLELTDGRSIFAWAIPVAVSVVILPPASVFVVDLMITAVFIYYSNLSWSGFQIYTLVEIYLFSFISWLGVSVANKALQDARNESRKNAAILEGVAEGVIVLGPNNGLVLANQAASELMGTEITKIVPGMESAEVYGKSLSFHWNQVEGVGWVSIVRDISRQVEIDHARDAILRVVSHEMRTPLATILGFAEILESRPVPGMATRIRANAQRMLNLVNDLLDVAQLQAGALPMHKTSFSPSILVSYVHENFLKLAKEKAIAMNVQISPSLPMQVTGDVERLEQVVTNLVENAIKFTDKDGRVDVSFCALNEMDWQVVVKDTGIGIPPERLPDIFEPFRRASDYATRKYQGIGLGLSIAKKIVQLSAGTISVESTVGKGSIFTVTLPINSNLRNIKSS